MGSEGTSSLPAEIRQLREELRERRSVDHLARAWSSGLAFLLLCGVWVKLLRDSERIGLFLWPGALVCLAVLAYVIHQIRNGLRLLAEDRSRLTRLRELEARAPPPRELF